ncbi:hypothetical protein E5Q_05588 [Mixia osmundae IAM 14324]|uniref:Actin-related protein 5 n=1 Tax=Mixia osmundae (strain CBS 9802 / IAM 14324 / JCM 22182 / KY 12970) TaxID=764103 RepID=G7E7U0_MIXOS|nr:hypothetical protein E5Q_05588 [Mixia osmundae IAM 14324]
MHAPAPAQPRRIWEVPERPTPAYIAPFADYSSISSIPRNALIIDNGGSEIRAGYASQQDPYVAVESLVSKYRERKRNQVVMLAGDATFVDNLAKTSIKAPHEGTDVVCNFDAMESLLDHVFIKLGVSSSNDRIEMPVAMTEPLCNLLAARAGVTEIMFEAYNVPSLTYAVDSLSAFYQSGASRDGLVVSSGNASTQIVPVLDGHARLDHAKRVSWGGATAASHILKLTQLKYPGFPTRVSYGQAWSLFQEHCYFSLDYNREIRDLASPSKLVAADRVIQFPFVIETVEEKSAEDLERLAKQRKDQGKRLQEQVARHRLEKLVQKEADLASFLELRQLGQTMPKKDYQRALEAQSFSDTAELDEEIKKIEATLQRARNKDMGIDPDEGKEPPDFSLVDVPDDQLDEDGIREKRKQRLMKAGFDARIRAKAEKAAEMEKQLKQAKEEEAFRLAHPQQWAAGLRSQYEALVNKMKDRKKARTQMHDRKSIASQARMKSIANLAADSPATKKRKIKGTDDGFGMDDKDWQVYREITTADDSEDEEDDAERLRELEGQLILHDPTFTDEHTVKVREHRKHTLFNAFLRGMAPDDHVDSLKLDDPEQAAQLHLNVERVRVPEVLYQPSIAGLDQAGLLEVIQNILQHFQPHERERLISNVFVTGRSSLVPNFDERLASSLTACLPVGAPLKVKRAADVRYDAWRGLRKFSQTDAFQAAGITLADYRECG